MALSKQPAMTDTRMKTQFRYNAKTLEKYERAGIAFVRRRNRMLAKRKTLGDEKFRVVRAEFYRKLAIHHDEQMEQNARYYLKGIESWTRLDRYLYDIEKRGRTALVGAPLPPPVSQEVMLEYEREKHFNAYMNLSANVNNTEGTEEYKKQEAEKTRIRTALQRKMPKIKFKINNLNSVKPIEIVKTIKKQ